MIAGVTIDTVRVRVNDRHRNPKAGVTVAWRVTAGGGTVTPASGTTDAEGRGEATWTTGTSPEPNTLTASTPGADVAPLSATVAAVTAEPPFRFAEDALWVSPSHTARVRVLDVRRREVPPTGLSFTVDNYSPGRKDNLVVDPGGVARLTGALGDVAWAFRVRASYDGEPVDGLVMVVAHATEGERTVFATEHWRIVVPPYWIVDRRSPAARAGLRKGFGRRLESPEGAAQDDAGGGSDGSLAAQPRRSVLVRD